jgi:integral membrane sensor domain MASE1
MKSGCIAGSDRPAARIAAWLLWARSSAIGMLAVMPAAIAERILSVRKSRLFIPGLLLSFFLRPFPGLTV